MENKEKLVAFLKETPNSNKQAITASTGISGLHLFNLLKKLQNDGIVVSHGEGDEVVYSLNEGQSVENEKQVEVTDRQPKEEKIVTQETQPVVQKTFVKSGRDNTKYLFNNETHGKASLVRAVVAKYVEGHPEISFEQLKEIFPDTLMKRFGVFTFEDNARSISGKVDRYFFRPEQMIQLKEGLIAVCNQWTAALLQPFLLIVNQLGYEVKTVE